MSPRLMAWFTTQPRRAPKHHRSNSTFARKLAGWLAVNGVAMLACGCSGDAPKAPGEFGQTPAAVEHSKQGLFHVSLYSSPTEVPVRGDNHVRIDLSTKTSSDAAVEPKLLTFMPAMGHGSGVTPELTLVEGQTYTFEDVVLNMPGRWELRLELETEDDDGETLTDQVVFEFDVD